VVGVDPSEEMINLAKVHLPSEYGDRVEYFKTTVEDLGSEHFEQYDLLIASEVVQHVQNPGLLLENCCKMLKVLNSSIPNI